VKKISGTKIPGSDVIARHLVESGAYTDKDTPVLLTSGESLTPYFLNTEKLCRDLNIGSFLDQHGDKSHVIIDHAYKLCLDNPNFQQDIDIIIKGVYELTKNCSMCAISGGQRRDWIFSGPVARSIGLPHISLYKQELGKRDEIEIVYPNGGVVHRDNGDLTLPFEKVVHIADLITKGSSIYSKGEDGKEFGWVPMLRSRNVKINDLFAVVTRLQGGEELLQNLEEPVNHHVYVAIDEEFLRTHSKQPGVVLDYIGDEIEWTQNYLIQNGIDVLVPYFEPNGNKLPRATKFLRNYRDFLEETDLIGKLGTIVQGKYNKSLNDIVGGN